MEKNFYTSIDMDADFGKLITLGAKNKEGVPEIKAVIAADLGFNLFSFSLNGKELIDGDLEQIKKTGFPGNPILYPTPNRVKNAFFTYNGKIYNQIKNGAPRNIHGLVYDEIWETDELRSSEEAAWVSARINFGKDFPAFESFPFEHLLHVTFKLTAQGVRLIYKVENRSAEPLPFGFAIHPYFYKFIEEKEAHISLPAELVFESDRERFPTGKILSVKNTCFDLREAKTVTSLDLDDVYTGVSGKEAVISWGDMGLKLSASPEFNQMVVYTPQKGKSFCLENQTCMTDAHNIFNSGDREKSGLILLKPGIIHDGWIFMEVI